MRLTVLPLWLFALGVIGTAATVQIAQHFDQVQDCRLYIDGCSTISGIGKHPPAVHVFRATIVPVAVLMMLVWLMVGTWLERLAAGSAVSRTLLVAAGALAPVGLIIYVIVIGVPGEDMNRLRDFSVRAYFLVAICAKIACGWMLLRAPAAAGRLRRIAVGLLALGVLLLIAALAGAAIEIHPAGPKPWRNVIQWWATTAFLAWYPLLWLGWRITGFRLEATIRGGP